MTRKVQTIGILFTSRFYDRVETHIIDHRTAGGQIFTGILEIFPAGRFKEARLFFEHEGTREASGRLRRRGMSLTITSATKGRNIVLDLKQSRSGGGYWGSWRLVGENKSETMLAVCCVMSVKE